MTTAVHTESLYSLHNYVDIVMELVELKSKVLKLLKEDEEFRYAVYVLHYDCIN